MAITFTNWETCSYHGTDVTLDWSSVDTIRTQPFFLHCEAIRQAMLERLAINTWLADARLATVMPAVYGFNVTDISLLHNFRKLVKRMLYNIGTLSVGVDGGLIDTFIDKNQTLNNVDVNLYTIKRNGGHVFYTVDKLKNQLNKSTILSYDDYATNMLPTAEWCKEVHDILNLLTKNYYGSSYIYGYANVGQGIYPIDKSGTFLDETAWNASPWQYRAIPQYTDRVIVTQDGYSLLMHFRVFNNFFRTGWGGKTYNFGRLGNARVTTFFANYVAQTPGAQNIYNIDDNCVNAFDGDVIAPNGFYVLSKYHNELQGYPLSAIQSILIKNGFALDYGVPGGFIFQ
jgi:hypothetical protein